MHRFMYLGLSGLLLIFLSTLAHSQEPRQIRAEPRIGQVSEEVVRQKLKTYGITNVREIRRVGNQLEIQGELDGKPVQLEMHSLTGVLREKGTEVPVTPGAKARELLIRPR
jgi:hypothetical protein